jgi:hypothetical protein
LSHRVEPSLAGEPRVRELGPDEPLRSFIQLTWIINANDPNWVPPLRRNVAAALDRRHPFHRHADVAYFLAERNNRPVGRIAAIVNHRHNEFHEDRVGFFGLFECEYDPDAAASLFAAASDWLRVRGCDHIRGPLNFSTNEELGSPGVLIEGFETRPAIMMSHNPIYYADLHEQAGFVGCKDLLAIHFADAQTIPEWGSQSEKAVLKRYNAVIRSVDLDRFPEEVQTIKGVYNAAWSRNWGFVPVTDEEFDLIAREFRPIVDPDLCLIAEVAGEPVGFSLAVPDINEVLRHIPDGRLFPFGLLKFFWYKRKIESLRLITFGFKPPFQQAGLGLGFYFRTWRTAAAKGYACGEASWILEDNYKMIRPLERMGGRVHRRYRIYERRLGEKSGE